MVKKWIARGYVYLVLLLMYLPIFLLIFFSFINTRVVGVIGPNDTFTFELYRRLFINERAMQAVGNTFLVAIVSSVIATILGTLGAIGIYYMKARGKKIFETLTQIPVINAEIVYGVIACSLIYLLSNRGRLSHACHRTRGVNSCLCVFIRQTKTTTNGPQYL
jgi:spermidine/putrescine transport system permease protein